MSDRDHLLYLEDICGSIDAIQSFVKDISFESFISDRKTFSATVRELEIIGEAAGRVSPHIQQQFPDIPWRTMKDFRNVLAHHYFGINANVVWDVVIRKLPELKSQIHTALKKLSEGTEGKK